MQLYYTTRILKFLNMQLYYTTPILKCNHIILHLQVYAIQRYRRNGLKCLIEFSCFQIGLEKLQIPECCLTHLFAATMVTFHTNCCHLLQLKLCRNNVWYFMASGNIIHIDRNWNWRRVAKQLSLIEVVEWTAMVKQRSGIDLERSGKKSTLSRYFIICLYLFWLFALVFRWLHIMRINSDFNIGFNLFPVVNSIKLSWGL